MISCQPRTFKKINVQTLYLFTHENSCCCREQRFPYIIIENRRKVIYRKDIYIGSWAVAWCTRCQSYIHKRVNIHEFELDLSTNRYKMYNSPKGFLDYCKREG